MQSQSLFLILFILIIAPILIISSNHNLFFGLVAFVLFIAALRAIYKTLSGSKQETSEEEQSEKEELEDMIGLDAQKFGIGAKVVKNLIVILFYIYSLFYMQHIWLKAIALLLIGSTCINIKRDLTEPAQAGTISNQSRLYSVYTLAANIFTLLVLALVTYNKMVTPLF
jgi:flagellar biosynthesis/type III secretory pathway M-ring protein FliF/YscJ